MINSTFRRSLALLPALLVFSAAPALAQDHGVDDSVSGRARPDYDPLGLRLRSFEVFPSIEVGTLYSDNIYAAETDTVSDFITEVSPAVAIRSTWSQHAANLSLEANARRYGENSAEDADTWRIGGDGRIDVRRTLRVYGAIGQSEGREVRGSNEPLDLAEPIVVREGRTSVSVEADFNRVRLTLGAGASDMDYDDAPLAMGGTLDQDFRDRSAHTWSARADYFLSPGTSLFASYDARAYDYDAALRDYETQQVLGGVSTEFGNLLRGFLGVGVVTSSFDAPGVAEPEGLSVSGRVEWFPQRMTTVVFDVSRDVAEAGVAPASSTLRESFNVRVDHELRRNIIVTAGVGRVDEDFNAIARDDETSGGNVGVRWLLNRLAMLSLTYVYDEKSSVGADRDRDFERNVLSLALTVQR